MKKFIILFLLIFQFLGYSQNAQDIIDNLKVELKANPDAKKTATIYSDLTWYYSNISIDSALAYGNKAIESSRKLGDSVLISQVYSDVGSVHFTNGNLDKSYSFYNKSLIIRRALKDDLGLAKVNSNIANILVYRGKLKEAMLKYIEVLEYYEKTKNVKGENIVNGNISELLYELKDYKTSLKKINKVISYNEINQNNSSLSKNYLTKANIFLETKDTTSAINFYKKSMQKSKEVGDKLTLSKAINNLGTIKLNKGKFKESLKDNKNVDELRKTINSDLDLARNKLNIASILISKGEYKNAKIILLEIKKVFEEKNSYESLISSYEMLIPIYAKLNEPDSVIYYQQKFKSESKKNNDLFVNNHTIELETKYQTEKKEKLLLQNEIESKKRNFIILGLSILAGFISLIGFLIFRQQKLKNKQQSQAFELKQAINQIETQNKLQDQRLAISKDLHDNIGAQLTFIISSVETAKYIPDVENSKLGNKLTQISDFTKDTIVELRDTIWAMNSNEISFEELQNRILNYIEKANNATENIDFEFNIDKKLNAIKLTSIVGMNVYRTIQEAINNSLKYANASNISVDIKKLENKIEIKITDNGIGFDKDKIVNGNGLNNMQKRIEEIGGTFQLNTEINKGSIISIII